MSIVRTCIWFEKDGEEAAKLYTCLIPNSKMGTIMRPDPNGPALIVNFELDGVPYMILNGGEGYPLSEVVSITVQTQDQTETDALWDALLEGGGAEHACAWLKDKYGLRWQIVPKQLMQCLSAPDAQAAGRAMTAMQGMKKINIAELEAAFRGE